MYITVMSALSGIPASFSSVTAQYARLGSRTISVNGKKETRKVAIAAISAQPQVYMPTHRQLTINNINPSFFNSTSRQSFVIRRNDIDQVNDLHLKITINVVGAPVVLAQLPYWFSQIDLRTSSDNALLATMYPDTMMANLCLLISAGKEKSLFNTLNIESSKNGYLGCTNSLAPGTYTFYLPMFVNSIIGNFQGLHLEEMTSDLSFDFTPQNPIVSGLGTITLQGMCFCVESVKLEDVDKAFYRSSYKMYSTENLFLDPVVTTYTSTILNAGQVNNFDLLPLAGLCSHQLLIVRPQGSINNNVANASFNWLNVGDESGAAIDLVDSSNVSLWGNGSPVSTRFMRSHLSEADNNFVTTKPGYLIKYCNSIRSSLIGEIKGAHKFVSSSVHLALTLPSAPLQEVQTITSTAVPNPAGFYKFSFRGEESVQLAATATAPQIIVALQSMKTFASQFITVIPSGTLSSGTALTLTFTHPATAGLEGYLVTIIGDGLASGSTTTRTVAGQSGLNTGVYDIQVFSYMFRCGSYVNGKLRSDLYLA